MIADPIHAVTFVPPSNLANMQQMRQPQIQNKLDEITSVQSLPAEAERGAHSPSSKKSTKSQILTEQSHPKNV